MKNNIAFKTGEQYADSEVIQQVVLGNTALYEIIIRRYNPFLYKTGRAYGFNHQDTEDLMQEAYINAYQHLAQFESRSTIKTWLVRIMLNQCYHKTRKQAYKNEKLLEDAIIINQKSQSMFPTNKYGDAAGPVIKKELSRIIESALHKLPEPYRMTFSLRELTGFTVAETAELMHTTTANVKVRLNRAKMLLRKEIEKIYSPDEIYEFNLIYCDKIVDAVMTKIGKLKA